MPVGWAKSPVELVPFATARERFCPRGRIEGFDGVGKRALGIALDQLPRQARLPTLQSPRELFEVAA